MNTTNTLSVRLFAVARQAAGRDLAEVALPEGATIAQLRATLAAAYPALAPILKHALFSVNAEYAGEASIIPAKAEIACIPPVSGG